MKKSILLIGAVLLMADSVAVEGKPALQIVDTVPLDCSVGLCMDNVPRSTREFSYEEAQMLMRIAQAEAGNQGIEGMELVMAVVLNRVTSEDFPDSIEEVIYQPIHFSSVYNGRYDSVQISREAHLALANIESGIPIDESIVAFEMTSNHRTLEKYFDYAYTYEGHDFYTSKNDPSKDAASGSRTR